MCTCVRALSLYVRLCLPAFCLSEVYPRCTYMCTNQFIERHKLASTVASTIDWDDHMEEEGSSAVVTDPGVRVHVYMCSFTLVLHGGYDRMTLAMVAADIWSWPSAMAHKDVVLQA